jgi:hypothetical protein
MPDGFDTMADNVNDLLPEMVRLAGAVEGEGLIRYLTIVGTLSLYKAQKPSRKAH